MFSMATGSFRAALSAAFCLAVISACLIVGTGRPAGAAPQTQAPTHVCGTPLPPGPIVEPPQIDMSSQPLNDLGWNELILRVNRSGDRFCYTYALDGNEQNVAPVIRVRPGERFAVRIVDELDGPASGATMAASALPQCKPMSMPDVPVRTYTGYMNHTIDARTMPMRDIDANIHFHGFEGPSSQDDVFVSALSTPEHACEYELTVPVTQPPGTYFYHPHAHGMADDEVSGGLAGIWIVEPSTPQIASSDDHAIVLRYRVPFVLDNGFLPDIGALERAGGKNEATRPAKAAVPFDPFNPPPWPTTVPVRGAQERLNACGSRPSVEFSVDGVDPPAELTVPSGQTQLLRVLNANADSIVYLRMRDAAGNTIPLRIVGRDGIPVGGDDAHPLAQFLSLNEYPLVPADRIDVLLTLQPGQAVTLYAAPHCTGPADEFKIPANLLVVRAGAPAEHPNVVASSPLQVDRAPATQLVRYAASHPALVRRRALTYTEYALPRPSGHGYYGAYFVTETSNPNFHEHPYWPHFAKGAQAPPPDIVVKRGTIEEWYLYNTTLEVHSFHLHQAPFVVEDGAGAPMFADTVFLPFGSLLPNSKDPDYPLVKPSLTRVLIDFRNVPRGTFVFHCHMLFHEDRGMMGIIRVV